MEVSRSKGPKRKRKARGELFFVKYNLSDNGKS